MRDLKDFTTGEWLRLAPLQHALKQARNDLWLSVYKRKRAANLDAFLEEVRPLAGKNIALVIAFEQPWALDWLLRMAKRHLTDTTILVFDNSLKTGARAEIERVCVAHKTPYLSLPPNRTRHVNRSHGMAMTWIFHNVVRAIEPRLFAFLDHDLIPVKEMMFTERLANQPFFGMLNRSENSRAWQLWAGYCMFDFSAVAALPMNFLYDFSQGLDTGGRNWPMLYRHYEQNQLRFAGNNQVEVRDPVTGDVSSVQIVDNRWFHIGSISYNDNFRSKSQFCENLAQAFDRGATWDQICVTADRDITK